MAFKKTLVQRLFNLSRFSTTSLCQNSSKKPQVHNPNPTQIGIGSDNIEPSLFKRVSNTRAKNKATYLSRLTLDGLVANSIYDATNKPRLIGDVDMKLTATQVEMIKEKLKNVGKDWVTHKEFVAIIEDFDGKYNMEQVNEFAKCLDDRGSVIFFRDYVFLRPHQVAKSLQNLVTPPISVDTSDPRRKELEKMEEQLAEIDNKGEALVRRELWAGLGYIAVQTAAFMRLTFWELSWDVMEPICFYVTCTYFILGYTFFLRTYKEPCFEGFFQSRFNSKRTRLIKFQEFDLERYNELRKVFYPRCSSSLDDYNQVDKVRLS